MVGVEGSGWRRGDPWARVSTEAVSQEPPAATGCTNSQRGGCSPQLPSHVSLFPCIRLCVNPFSSHGSQHQYPNIFTKHQLGLFLHVMELQGRSNDLLAGKHSALESGATWWPWELTSTFSGGSRQPRPSTSTQAV